MKIEPDVVNILKKSTVSDNILFLPSVTLDRNLYLKVNKVIELIGGKWNRAKKGHIFQIDVNVDNILNNIITYGEVIDTKKEYQFFRTPLNIVNMLIGLANISKDDIILEPSAGDGAIVNELKKIIPISNIHLFELNTEMYDKYLRPIYMMSHNIDFLQTETKPLYNKVIMNPPFSKQQDVDHIYHAFSCLKNDGILVSIVSESPFFRENKKSIDFRLWLDNVNAEVLELDCGAFKESGTMVKTRIIKVTKHE